MAIDANAYTVTDGTSEKTIPLIYGKEDVLVEELYNAQTLRPYLKDVTRYYKGAGKTMQIPVENVHWAISALTEGTATPISALGWTSQEMSFVWYGDAKQFTLESDAVVASYTLGNFRGNALSAIGENRDLKTIAEWSNTTTSAVYPIDAGTKETSSTISLEYQLGQTLRVQTQMLMNKLSLSRIIIHPLQRVSLLNDEKMINKDYGAGNALNSGNLVDNYGVEYVVHNAIQSVTENSKTVYIAYGIVDKPTFYAQKQAPVFELDRRDILNRAWTFHYYEAFGLKNIRDAGIVPIKSVGATI